MPAVVSSQPNESSDSSHVLGFRPVNHSVNRFWRNSFLRDYVAEELNLSLEYFTFAGFQFQFCCLQTVKCKRQLLQLLLECSGKQYDIIKER